MTASADTAPSDVQANRGPKFQVLGTGDGNDGAFATGIVLIDPTSGSPYAATAGNASNTVALHDTTTPSQGATVTASGQLEVALTDGADATLGTTTDAATANTVVGRLKKLISLLPTALTGSGNLKTAVVEALPAGTNVVGGVTVADGADATLGTTTDAATANTVVGRLKKLISLVPTALTGSGNLAVGVAEALPAGTNTVGGVYPVPSATNGATYAACAASGTTTAKASAGVLKALAFAGTGTAGTVALVDGSTTIFTAGVPAAVGTWALPLPPEGVALGTSIKITTSGTGVTALAVYV